MKQVEPVAAITRYYPLPTSLVTTVDGAGRDNLLTVGWFMRASIDPVMVVISLGHERYSYHSLLACREFALCLPSQNLAEAVWYCGTHSGRHTDKFAAGGLKKLPAKVIRPVLVAGSAVAMECRVNRVVETGDHTLFVAEVVAAHMDESCPPLLFDFGSSRAQLKPIPLHI